MREDTGAVDVAETLAEFIARFGEAALDLCATVRERMAANPGLAACVSERHASLAAQYVQLGAATDLATAQAAGRRAMLIVLLLESEARFFAA